MCKFVFASIFFLFIVMGFGQQNSKNSYQFAHSYIGLENEILVQKGTFSSYNQSGELSSTQLPSYSSTRLIIGGTHFWDHADFYISIPLFEIEITGSNKAKISSGVLTGFKYYPFKLKSESARPYAGIGFGGATYSQEGGNGKGPTVSNRQWYYETGLTIRPKPNQLIEFGVRYFKHKSYNYPVSRNEFEAVKLQNFTFQLSYKRLFDFTQSYGSESMKKYIKNTHEVMNKEGALSAFSIGIGFSATIPLEPTEYSEKTPSLNQETTQNGNIEVGLAYYLHKLDAAARISYRPLKQKESAYGYTSTTKTHSLALEAFKFIGNYHGFVPFIGPYLGLNRYHLVETDYGEKITDYTADKLAYGLVFGWDIRLSDIDFIILRTNLRYTPDLNHLKDGLSYTNKQLEFNFIQLVYYPERHKIQKSL